MQFKITLDRTAKLFSETGSLFQENQATAIRKRTSEVVNPIEEIMENEP